MNHIALIDGMQVVVPQLARPSLSVVIPMYNEVGNARHVIEEVAESLRDIPHEIIVVDDGSTDGTIETLQAIKDELPVLRVLRHAHNAGQSRAVRTGVLAAKGSVVATIDGDGQNPAEDIPVLYDHLLRDDAPEKLAMVGGARNNRQDKASRLLGAKIARIVRRRVLGDPFDDTGCGLKVFKRDAFLRVPYFDHVHRYLPLLMRREGFSIESHPVGHRPRMTGRSKYTNLGRAAVAIRDLLGVLWLRDRARDPRAVEEV